VQYYFAIFIFPKRVRGDSRLTPKDYRPNYLRNVRTYHDLNNSTTWSLLYSRVPYPIRSDYSATHYNGELPH